MAENKTIEEQLAEADRIAAEKTAKEKRDRAKKKAASDKADAEYKKREQTKERIAKENMQRASTYSAGSPQRESGKASKTRENVNKINTKAIANEYSQIIRTQESLIDTYRKTSKDSDRQAAINYQSKVDAVAKRYSDIIGHAPTGYSGTLDLPPAPVTKTGSPNSDAPTTGTNDSMQSRDVARAAGRNAAPAPAITPDMSKVKVDPLVIKAWLASNAGATYDQAVAAMYGSQIIEPGGGGTSNSNVSVDRRVQTFTTQQLEDVATRYAQELLGRALTKSELAAVTNFTNTQARKTPQVSRTVTNSSASDPTLSDSTSSSSTSSTTTSGGIDENQLIKSQIEANPEFANYQKATTYFDAMLNTLQGPVGGGI